ncbi:molybdopterin biosynthesis protein [Christensenellaceae bacterium OttesenSCG-928-M15]|nr:molybdopterin biosynthesis protein [Christensenellaceae bacterium OttesenSCG-928-M15]
MAFQYLTNVPLEQAVEEYIAALEQNGLRHKAEWVSVAKSAGRVTAAPVYARICAPHYHACAMDGIAVYAAKTFGATETTPVLLTDAQYTPVDTGDPLPEDCDAVVMIEDVVQTQGGILLYAPATPWQHVRQIGEDICAAEMILASFTKITPAATGAMLASGVLSVEVVKRPLVGIIPTGDEIVLPTENPHSGDIIEFNSTIFTGMLNEWGAEALAYPIVKDDPALIEAALQEALTHCDAVVLNAGSSAGRGDFAAQAIRNVGEVLYHGIAIRPGKPAILGYAGNKPVLGVPGYPVSAILVLEHILQPVIYRLCARPAPSAQHVEAVLSRNFNSSLKYREFVRVRMGRVQGKLVATPLQRGAGVVSSFAKADGLMDVPQNVEGYPAGSTVRVQLLRPLTEIENALVVTGSHDPLIDEVAELMRRRWPDAAVASTHVGSMGGIFAIKRGEAHVAGVHLLDEKTGAYNAPYIRQYFPDGGVSLIECVQRQQGLLVQKGNPKQIHSLADMAQPGMRYVNRQKGSGTRILCDYLCKQLGLNSAAIYGYEREEFTHNAVAALIAADSADAGLGIYSAAQTYGLSFIPICTEQYDFLVADEALALPALQRLLEVLKSEEFRQRLQQMGGYEISNPGTPRTI